MIQKTKLKRKRARVMKNGQLASKNHPNQLNRIKSQNNRMKMMMTLEISTKNHLNNRQLHKQVLH